MRIWSQCHPPVRSNLNRGESTQMIGLAQPPKVGIEIYLISVGWVVGPT